MFRKRSTLLGIGFGLVLALAQLGIGAAHGTEPSISITDRGTLEGTRASVRVTLSAATDCIVTVNYTTADGTAWAPYDYVHKSGTLTFYPGETSKYILINTVLDLSPEPDKYFFVNLSGASHATIADGQGQVDITDIDGEADPNL